MDTGGGCEVCVEGCVLCGGWRRRRRREESPSYERAREEVQRLGRTVELGVGVHHFVIERSTLLIIC